MKHLLTSFFIITSIMMLAVTADARKKIRRELTMFSMKVPEAKKIGESQMEFMYDYKWSVDTTDTTSFAQKKERMILQVGNGISRFSSYRRMQIDSLLRTATADDILGNTDRYSGGLDLAIVKHLEEGSLTLSDKICQDWFEYTETIPQFDWQLTGETNEILGYQCQLAVCEFRGRKFSAWFCDEIPIDNGPWKFGGLPGLIMKVSDSNNEHVFSIVGIYTNVSRDITEPDVARNKTDRKRYYNTLHSFHINPYSYAQTVSGTQITVTDQSGNPDPTAFDPMDIDYDYIERDWKD